jgi:hypothetical protein
LTYYSDYAGKKKIRALTLICVTQMTFF